MGLVLPGNKRVAVEIVMGPNLNDGNPNNQETSHANSHPASAKADAYSSTRTGESHPADSNPRLRGSTEWGPGRGHGRGVPGYSPPGNRRLCVLRPGTENHRRKDQHREPLVGLDTDHPGSPDVEYRPEAGLVDPPFVHSVREHCHRYHRLDGHRGSPQKAKLVGN